MQGVAIQCKTEAEHKTLVAMLLSVQVWRVTLHSIRGIGWGAAEYCQRKVACCSHPDAVRGEHMKPALLTVRYIQEHLMYGLMGQVITQNALCTCLQALVRCCSAGGPQGRRATEAVARTRDELPAGRNGGRVPADAAAAPCLWSPLQRPLGCPAPRAPLGGAAACRTITTKKTRVRAHEIYCGR